MNINKFFVAFLTFAFAVALVGCTSIVSVPEPDQAVGQAVDDQEEIQVNKETVRSFLIATELPK